MAAIISIWILLSLIYLAIISKDNFRELKEELNKRGMLNFFSERFVMGICFLVVIVCGPYFIFSDLVEYFKN